MAVLRWRVGDLKSMIAHAMAATDRRASFGDQCEIDEDRAGLGTITQEEVNAHVRPTLHLVKDSGIYLMSNGWPMQPKEEGGEGGHVVYARGYDPRKGDVWDKCRAAVGGDDFVESLTPDFVARLADMPDHCELEITMTAESMSCDVFEPRPRPARRPSQRKAKLTKAQRDMLAQAMGCAALA